MIQFSLTEISAIEGQLDNEIDLIDKYKSFCETTTDPQLKILYQQISATHQNHYKMLMKLLTSN